MNKKDFAKELQWRGLLHDIMPGTAEALNSGMVTGYVGFDPTASSLTIGNMVTVMLLVHLQQAGHKPMALVGGATGMIGDPSGRSDERKFLTEEALVYNQQCIKKQLEKFLDFNNGATSAEIVNNYDWFKDISWIQFLRDAGKHLTVNYMMAKDSVKKRMDNGISFTEFSYQLMQGYDFYHLYKNKGVRLQMGGSDQWGNITSGTELIRRIDGGEAFALTCPLLTRADGTKFGKSEGQNVWLSAEMSSPYKFYQFWINLADEDAARFIKIFTTRGEEEIEALITRHSAEPHLRLLQKELAEDITVRVHSRADLENALKASDILFGKGTAETLATLDEATLLSVMEGVPMVNISRSDWESTENITDFLSVTTQSTIFSSKGEARKMIQGGGVSVNKTKVEDPTQKPVYELLNNKYLLVQKGKKNYHLVVVNA